jgi:hypothetical protein
MEWVEIGSMMWHPKKNVLGEIDNLLGERKKAFGLFFDIGVRLVVLVKMLVRK